MEVEIFEPFESVFKKILSPDNKNGDFDGLIWDPHWYENLCLGGKDLLVFSIKRISFISLRVAFSQIGFTTTTWNMVHFTVVLPFCSSRYKQYKRFVCKLCWSLREPDPREDAGGLSREYVLRIPSVS